MSSSKDKCIPFGKIAEDTKVKSIKAAHGT
ncbi:hypothetical protein DFH70_001290 [Clostridium beijerinckii]|nr:hypothetical protein [Clostridium beijerinckii]NRY43383.1 hypothetical protein [Clostridium beijerinckii]NRZ85193.1 hypothetical protein [Clostridium beijerinckii]